MMVLFLLIFSLTPNAFACDIAFYDKSGKTYKTNSKESILALQKGTSLIVWIKAIKEEKEYIFFEVRETIKGHFPFSRFSLSKNSLQGPAFEVIKANKSEPLFGTYSNHKHFDHSRQRMSDCSLTSFRVKIDHSYIYFFGDNSEFTFEQVETKDDNIYKTLKGL